MKTAKPKAHVSEKKKKQTKELEKLFTDWPVIAIVDMSGLPGAQLQKIRNNTKNELRILVTKKRLIKLAIEAIKEKKKNIADFEQCLTGIPGLIFTKLNPFKLYQLLLRNKSSASIKPGQLAPHDLIIPAGPTPFTPGPMIGELTSMGIKSGVEGGKIAIKQEFTAAKTGEPVNMKIASLLMKLGVEPIEIGLNLTAVYDEGIIFKKDVLAIDINSMLSKAIAEARALSLEQGIITKETIEELLSRANAQALSLKTETNT
jgi:large subunit ribosomal protein L10